MEDKVKGGMESPIPGCNGVQNCSVTPLFCSPSHPASTSCPPRCQLTGDDRAQA
jgi:hypothetical protein